MINLVGYATSTRVQLDFPAERLLSSTLMDAVNDNLTGGLGLAKKIGQERGPKRKNSETYVAVATMENLVIEVAKFDAMTGVSYPSKVSFSVTAKNDHGTGRLRVASELKYDDHVALLDAIISQISPSP
jgi:hypothetical protein